MGKIFGQRLRSARLAAGIPSVNKLADLSGFEQPNLNRIELGRGLLGEVSAPLVARALGIPLAEIEAWTLEERVSSLPPEVQRMLLDRIAERLDALSGAAAPPPATP